MRTLVVACAAALVSVGAPRPAHADEDLAEARRLEAALDYDRALAVVDRALAHGGADPATLAELHLLAGRLAAGLDRTAVAEDHFARALALRPDLALPAGASPKLTTPFDAARGRGLAPLKLTATAVRGLITVVVIDDPLGLVAGVAVHTVDGAGHHAEVVERAARRAVIAGDASAIEVAALDAAGNRLWVGTPGGAPNPPPPPSRRTDPRPALAARWSTWAAVSGLTLVGAGLAGWRARVAQDEWDTLRAQDGQHDYSALRTIEERGQRWALTADLALGLAAASGAAAVYVALRHDDAPATAGLTLGLAGPLSVGYAGGF